MRPRGGYSLYVGWYGCAAVLIPLLTFSVGWNTILLGYFYSSPTPKRSFGILKKLPILKEFDLFCPKFHVPSIFWGPTFSNQRHIPTGFRTPRFRWYDILSRGRGRTALPLGTVLPLWQRYWPARGTPVWPAYRRLCIEVFVIYVCHHTYVWHVFKMILLWFDGNGYLCRDTKIGKLLELRGFYPKWSDDGPLAL